MELDAKPLSDRQLFLEGMTTLQEHAAAQLGFSRELANLLHASPARMSVETLTAASPVKSAYELGEAQSIGVLNWSAVTVQIGFAGRSATAGNGIAVPAGSWVVLPLACNMIDLGATVADLTLVGEAHVGIIRFDHRQELAAGGFGGPVLPLGPSTTTTATVANPTAFGFIAELDCGAGVFDVDIVTAQAGTYDSKAANINFYFGSADAFIAVLPSLAMPVTTRLRRLQVPALHPYLTCYTNLIGGAGSIYVASITATRVA